MVYGENVIYFPISFKTLNNITYFLTYITLKRIKWLTFAVHFKINIMPLLTILLVLIVVGVILWLVNTYIPMDRKIKSILNIIVVIVVVAWLLQAFGLLDSLKNLRT